MQDRHEGKGPDLVQGQGNKLPTGKQYKSQPCVSQFDSPAQYSKVRSAFTLCSGFSTLFRGSEEGQVCLCGLDGGSSLTKEKD